MATKKGRGWRGDPDRHKSAGSKGGKATVRAKGIQFFAKIGTQGGAVSGGNFKNNRELAQRAGRRGVQKRREKKARIL